MSRTQSAHIANYREIGKKIAFYRKGKNLTQEQLAQKIGVSKSYISKIESANYNEAFSLDIMFSIANALNLDAGLFLLSPDMLKQTIYVSRCSICGQDFSAKFCYACGAQLDSSIDS